MGRFRFIAGMIAIAAALALSCGTGDAAKQESKGSAGKKSLHSLFVAEWQDGSVTASQLEEYAISKAGMAMRHGSELTQDGLRILLEELIGGKILAREAQGGEVVSDPRFIGSYEIASAQEVANRYIRDVLKDRFAVTDNEVAALLPASKDLVRIKVIVVPTEEEAGEVLKMLKAGMTFDEGVEKHSQVKTAPGVFIDLRNTDDYLDEAGRERIRSLPRGDLSPVLPMRIGYGIALVIEKREMDDKEWNANAQEKRVQLFQKRVGQHHESLRKKAEIDINTTELMLAAGEDFEFLPSRRVVLTVSGKPIYFDDYVRTRDTHLRDAMKIGNPKDLFNAYKIEFENLGTTLGMAMEAASEQGWSEPQDDRKKQIREKLALRVLGETLFNGIVVTDAEARKEYDGNKKVFTIEKRYKLRRVTFPNAGEANRFRKSIKSAEMFYKELRSRETRDDRFQNTFFEWQDLSRMDEKTRKELEKTRKGKLSGVISVSPEVNHVYYVDDIQKNYLVPYEEVRVNIKRAVLRNKQERKLAEFVDARRKKYGIKIHEDRLGGLLEEMNRKRKKLDPGHGKGAGDGL